MFNVVMKKSIRERERERERERVTIGVKIYN